MDNFTMTVRRASFTVEAVFVTTMVVSVLLGLCYFTLYVHDKTVVPSLIHAVIEIQTKGGQSSETEELAQGIKEELKGRLFLMDVNSVKVKSGLFELTAEVKWQTEIRAPFVREICFPDGTGTITVSHGTLSAPELMWDSKLTEGAAGDESDGN